MRLNIKTYNVLEMPWNLGNSTSKQLFHSVRSPAGIWGGKTTFRKELPKSLPGERLQNP